MLTCSKFEFCCWGKVRGKLYNWGSYCWGRVVCCWGRVACWGKAACCWEKAYFWCCCWTFCWKICCCCWGRCCCYWESCCCCWESCWSCWETCFYYCWERCGWESCWKRTGLSKITCGVVVEHVVLIVIFFFRGLWESVLVRLVEVFSSWSMFSKVSLVSFKKRIFYM